DKGVVTDYSFGSYPISLVGHGAEVVSVPVKEGFVPDGEALAAACDDQTKMLFLANPNNPTGTYLDEAGLRHLLTETPEHVVVVIDEAYHDYIQADDYKTALELRDLRERLIVTRTFSKCYGLAGLRVGYAISRPEIIDLVNRIRKPFNVNLVAQQAARVALADRDFVVRSVEVNEAGRAQLERGFEQMSALGVDWIRSQTNFLLVEMPVAGRRIFEAMLRRGIILRPMDGYGLPDYLRISIGTEEQNARCLEHLSEVLERLTTEEASA
ncbi:MAG: pyridoxal phosphate-dependent aminotransferase, partial [Persicimonas sp.]